MIFSKPKPKPKPKPKTFLGGGLGFFPNIKFDDLSDEDEESEIFDERQDVESLKNEEKAEALVFIRSKCSISPKSIS